MIATACLKARMKGIQEIYRLPPEPEVIRRYPPLDTRRGQLVGEGSGIWHVRGPVIIVALNPNNDRWKEH